MQLQSKRSDQGEIKPKPTQQKNRPIKNNKINSHKTKTSKRNMQNKQAKQRREKINISK